MIRRRLRSALSAGITNRALVVGIIGIAVMALNPITASAVELKVVTLGDTGDGTCDATCTLRDAIDDANATTIVDTITFDIPDSPITPTSPLPGIQDPVIIDGFSDPTSERVELDGSAAGAGADGLRLSTADNSTIKGLVINGFLGDGIHIQPGATLNRVEGNYIGTDAAGTAADPNGAEGVHVEGENNTIGGSTAEARNVISGNTSNGVRIASSTAGGNVVAGNYIGTNAAGTAALGNTNSGVVVTSSANGNVIGGTSEAARNVISGNGENGVRIFGAGTTGNLVQSNLISGNTRDGVEISGDSTVVGNAVLGNSISGNGNSTIPHDEMGIDLVGVNGVDANDAGDTDTGPNNLQNFPVLTSAASSATTTTISGTLNSEALVRTYRLDFFSNDACDPSGNGEGQTFLGTTDTTTDGAGNATFTASLPVAVAAGQVVTATATDPANNTSEFSACTPVAVDTTPGPPAPPPPPPAPPPPPVRCPGFQSDSRTQFVGTSGNDVLEGTSGRDIICGLGGNDTIRGLGRGDVLIGGPGADVLIGGRGNDIVRAGRGRDIVRGGRGRDTLLGGRGADTLLGGRGNDVLRGGPRRDVLDGGRGRDRCRGGRGNDVLRRCEE